MQVGGGALVHAAVAGWVHPLDDHHVAADLHVVRHRVQRLAVFKPRVGRGGHSSGLTAERYRAVDVDVLIT